MEVGLVGEKEEDGVEEVGEGSGAKWGHKCDVSHR